MKARIDTKGLFACFDAGLAHDSGDAVNVEISAVAWDGRRLVFGSDKNVPGRHRSPVFALEIDDGRPVADSLGFYTASLIKHAEKYEDFALSDDGQFLIATTGFDRVDDDSAAQDAYNRLLVWPVDAPDDVQLVADRHNDGVASSVPLRDDLSTALGAPYFKIEGLASIPGEDAGDDPLLLFGIREVGADHENFTYVAQVVAAPYRIDQAGALSFTGAFEMVYEFEPAAWPAVRFDVGLSSLEFDPTNDRLLFLTSFEVDDGAGGDRLGAYLWSLDVADFHAGRAPRLVHDEQGEALEFANKAEGVAVLPDGRLFVVYDPDRALKLESDHPRDARDPHEAPYTLLTLVDET
ncbi:hypothetical protein [Salinisphaera sp. Q1T1-3]|uniref:hypothetical protein n=1 Tax=Salinisphaera sp. Q1T1-3 TaxID=2321229 RepID=UPI0018F54A28|nr:hypothetical protein [Salinisphaera sp. Q1T1-3]